MTTRYVDSAAAGLNDGTSKVNAYTTFAAAIAAMAAGDTILVNSTHVEPTNTSGATVTLLVPGSISARSKLVSVNFSTDVPTQGAALYTTTGATPLTINGVFRAYGFNISVGSGAVTAALSLATTAASIQQWDSCGFTIVATGAGSNITPINNGGGGLVQWNNVTCTFGATGQGLIVGTGNNFSWRNDSGVAALAGATYPAALFKTMTGAIIRLRGLDLNMYNSGRTLWGTQTLCEFEARNCRFNPNSTNAPVPILPSQINGVDFINCKDGATAINDYRARYQGSATTETTIVRTGGATSGATPFSWKISPISVNGYDSPFVAFEAGLWNTVLTAQTLSIHVVTDNLTLTDADIWVSVEYLSSASYPVTTVITDRAAGDPIPSAANQAASTETWTTTGLTTPNKQKLNVTFTAAMAGPIRVKVVVAKTSGTIYVCPKADLA